MSPLFRWGGEGPVPCNFGGVPLTLWAEHGQVKMQLLTPAGCGGGQ
jgi:hypothetical protein